MIYSLSCCHFYLLFVPSRVGIPYACLYQFFSQIIELENDSYPLFSGQIAKNLPIFFLGIGWVHNLQPRGRVDFLYPPRMASAFERSGAEYFHNINDGLPPGNAFADR